MWPRNGNGRARKPDPGMVVNGMLAGLVAITAPCAFTNPAWSAVIGSLAGQGGRSRQGAGLNLAPDRRDWQRVGAAGAAPTRPVRFQGARRLASQLSASG